MREMRHENDKFFIHHDLGDAVVAGPNARVTDPTIAANPDVPWSSIKRMRDRLEHHYEATDYDAVWATISFDLPRVRAAVEPLLTAAGCE